MITTALIGTALYLINLILSIFPASSGFPSEFDTAIGSISGYIGILNPIIPIPTMATIISLIIVFELTVFAFKGVRWLLSYVPLLGGKG